MKRGSQRWNINSQYVQGKAKNPKKQRLQPFALQAYVLKQNQKNVYEQDGVQTRANHKGNFGHQTLRKEPVYQGTCSLPV